MANKKNLVTNVDWCKGCSVCVAFCPKQVLKIENEKIVIAEREKCISCGMCELRCPDNAIYLVGGNNDEQ
jgi:2-oxoglutarate ferredoxin oxidoreductase subunit delta